MFFQVLIQNAKDLMNVEPHKLVIIFVDFNNRNIILENEDTEIGDLRNQTTKMFLSLKCKYRINEEENCLYFIFFVSLVDEKFLIDIYATCLSSSRLAVCSMLAILLCWIR